MSILRRGTAKLVMECYSWSRLMTETTQVQNGFKIDPKVLFHLKLTDDGEIFACPLKLKLAKCQDIVKLKIVQNSNEPFPKRQIVAPICNVMLYISVINLSSSQPCSCLSFLSGSFSDTYSDIFMGSCVS